MAPSSSARPPRWFWIVSALAVVWSVVGCLACFTQLTMSAEDLGKLPEAQREAWRITPAWVKGVYALAVGSSLAGSALLLALRRVARPVLVVSLAAVVVQFGFTFLGTRTLALIGPSAVVLPLFIIAVGGGLVGLARHAQAAGWLRA